MIKTILARVRGLWADDTNLVDENGRQLTKADVSRNTIRLALGYIDHLQDARDGIRSQYDKGIEELNTLAKSNEAVASRSEKTLDIISSNLIKGLKENTELHVEAVEEFEKALSSHLSLLEEDFAYKRYIPTSLGRKRETMPQIDSDNIDDVILHFSSKSPDAKVTKESIAADKLEFIQGEINEDKVKKMLQGGVEKMQRFLVAKNKGKYYLIDGHHRFCVLCEMDENPSINVYAIHLDPREAVRRLNLMKLTNKVDNNDDNLSKSEMGCYDFDNCIVETEDIEKAIEHAGYKFERVGDVVPSKSKGKKAAVLGKENGKYVIFHFGDSSMGHNYSKEARSSATARHKKNLEGNSARSKAFRAYWKKYWSKGGKVKKSDNIEKAMESFDLINNFEGLDEAEYQKAVDHMDSILEKAQSDLVKKQVWVTRGGKTFQQTVYVKPGEDEKQETPIGGDLAPEIAGMNITRYSEKALIIKGDTYVNKDEIKKIKEQTGVGAWNKKQQGWVFPMSFKDTVLGELWSALMDKGEDEKAEAVQNQKNAGYEIGDTFELDGLDFKVLENVSTDAGIKYKCEMTLTGDIMTIDEKLLSKPPMTNNKEIAEVNNTASPAARVPLEKKVFGFKAITDVWNYSLYEYADMHGITQADIDAYLKKKAAEPKDKKPKKSSPSVSKDPNKKSSGLTKNQIIARILAKHKQAVEKAINDGMDVPDKAVELYPELAKKKKTLSEEHKKKIAEALKKNNPAIEQKDEEVKAQSDLPEIDKVNYKPKDYKEKVVVPATDGYKNEEVPLTNVKDYTDVPPTDVTIPKPKKVLSEPKPYFIPEISDDTLKKNSYTVPAIKLGEDKYLVALDGFRKSGMGMTYLFNNSQINADGRYAIMSLDAYTATENYYQIKSKQQYKVDQEAKMAALKEKTLANYIEKYGEEEAKAKFKKAYFGKIKRLKVLTKNSITVDQYRMIERMKELKGKKAIFEEYYAMQEEKSQKAADIALHQEYIDSAYSKGKETSYGESNTKNDLMGEFGVKVKKQNGDEISKAEVNQIKSAMDSVAKVFGNNVEMNKEYNLKISHSGDVLQHASKAIGIFHPVYKSIGVSNQMGDTQFKFTFGHEYAHFMDYWVGNQTGNTFASDKQGSTANKIASAMRKHYNKKDDSKYWNRTCECFARSLEQYHAVESMGDKSLFSASYYVNEQKYNEHIKPLVEQFLKENKDILKSFHDQFFKSEEGSDKKRYAANIIRDEKGRILFLRRHPQDEFEPNTLVLPSGGIDEGETPEDAAVRELFEETNLEASEVTPVAMVETDDAVIYYHDTYTKDNPNFIILDEEHLNYEWWSMDELKKDASKQSELILDLYDHLERICGYKLAQGYYRDIEKAYNDGAIGDDDFLTAKTAFDKIEKAKKDISKLKKVRKLVFVNGKPKQVTYYVKGDEKELAGIDASKKVYEDIKDISMEGGQPYQITMKDGKKLTGIFSHVTFSDKGDKAVIIQDDGSKRTRDLSKIKSIESVDKILKEEQEKSETKTDEFGYKIIKTLGGSTGAVLVEKDGKKFVKKTANDPEHLANEVRSIKYFKQMGVPVPEVEEYQKGKAVYLEHIEGQELGKLAPGARTEANKKISQYYLAHALMANHDVVGMNADNIMIKENGDPVFIDVGGSMGFRAQGGKKESWENWKKGDPVSEIQTMVNKNINAESAYTFADHVFTNNIKDQLKAIKEQSPDWFNATGHSQKLKDRFDKVNEVYGEQPKPEPKPEPAPVKDEQATQYIKNMYYNEKNTVNKYSAQMGQFYDDLAEWAGTMTPEEKKYLDENITGLNTGEFASYLENNKDLNEKDVAILNEYTGGSYGTITNGMRNLISADYREDGYNMSVVKDKAKKGKVFDDKAASEMSVGQRVRVKQVIQLFSKLEKSTYNNKDYVKDRTLYRGFSVDHDSSSFKSDNDIVVQPNMASFSIDRNSFFSNKNTVMAYSGASGIDIHKISGFGTSEMEVVTKPFAQLQLFSAKIKKKNSYEEVMHVKAEKPGLTPFDPNE